MRIVLPVLLVVPALSQSNVAHTTSMTSREVAAFQEVARNCEADVARLCDSSASMRSLHAGQQDPFTDFWPAPFFSMQSDFSTLMDQLMDSALSMPSQGTWVVMVEGDEDHDKGDLLVTSSSGADEMDRAVQDIVSRLAVSSPFEDLLDISERMVQHSQHLLEQPDITEDKVRIARRLTEVTPEELQQERRNFLPFGEHNRCVLSAYEQGALSSMCGNSVQRLHQIRTDQYVDLVQYVHEQIVMWLLLAVLALVSMTVAVLFIRRKSSQRERVSLERRILTAIYSRPELKASVERQLGEPLGDVTCSDDGCDDYDEASCEKKGRGQKHRLPAKNVVYEGIPIPIV